MNPVDQMLLDSLVMQLELGKLKKPGNITMEILPSGPVRSMEDDEHETAESMYHEMFESEEDDSKKFVDEDDYEGGMALVELNAIIDKAATITNMIEENTELPAWIQSKITLAAHNISAAHDYLKYKNCK
jgi:hypothetical protein